MIILAGGGVAVALLGFLWLRHRAPRAAAESSPPATAASPLSGPAEPVAPSTINAGRVADSTTGTAEPLASASFTTIPVIPATPFVLGTADQPAMEPATVLSNMRIVIRQYGSQFGGNPIGTNPDITKALNGDNPRQARFLREDSGLRINARGELVDYWGTPFFFHQLSGTEMEIHSAGPDRVMWTPDDLVTK